MDFGKGFIKVLLLRVWYNFFIDFFLYIIKHKVLYIKRNFMYRFIISRAFLFIIYRYFSFIFLRHFIGFSLNICMGFSYHTSFFLSYVVFLSCVVFFLPNIVFPFFFSCASLWFRVCFFNLGKIAFE